MNYVGLLVHDPRTTVFMFSTPKFLSRRTVLARRWVRSRALEFGLGASLAALECSLFLCG